MSHLDRLRELVYVSPSGVEFRPLWDGLERSSSKKAAVHEIPQSDVADVQDLGNNAERWPMSLYFIGADYDTQADKFYNALRERGRAVLKHPRWGDLDVLPLTISQTENMVDDLRAARFSVEFVHAPDLSLIATTNTAAAIQSAADDASDAAADSASTQLTAHNATELAKLKDKIVKRVQATAKKLKVVAAKVDETRQSVEAQSRAIERSIDSLVNTPLVMAQNIISLARTPAQLSTSIKDKAAAYSDLIIDAVENITGLTLSPAVSAVVDMIALVIALCESVTAGTLSSRSEAVVAHDTLVDAIAQVEAAIDYLQVQGYVPDPVLLELLADLKARAAAYLLSAAYDLPAERTYVTESAMTPLELSYRLLGDEARADELITINGWGGDMILVVPAGAEVRYYA